MGLLDSPPHGIRTVRCLSFECEVDCHETRDLVYQVRGVPLLTAIS